MDYRKLDIIKKFINDIVFCMSRKEHNVDFIKFVFKEEDLEEIFSNLDLEYYKTQASYNILKKNIIDYNNREDKECTFIKIDDYNGFFTILRNIYDTMNNSKLKRKFDFIGLCKSIWLRMGVDDLENVNSFLKKQLSYLVGDYLFNGTYENFKDDIYYLDESNDNFFETNNHIRFMIKKDNKRYDLPVIHYGITSMNSEIVCDIYGIQNLGNEVKDEELKDYLKEEKKFLRNKKVSAEFIISLKMFIDLINDYGIEKVRIPLLQVFNYPYHESLSLNVKENFELYSEDEVYLFEKMIEKGLFTDAVFDYEHNKKVYGKFVGKEDLISKNKTERLIDTLMVMEEKYGNIEFLTEPFIESDHLLIKTLKEKVKTMI